MFDFVVKALDAKRQQGLFRQATAVAPVSATVCRVNGQELLNFAGNDYLGMAHHPQVVEAWQRGLDIYGAGSGASPLVSGHTLAHQQLCESLAAALERDKVMLFSSGFAANHAVLQAYVPKGVSVFMDKLSHASMIDGALAASGTLKRFAHNDLQHLAALLAQNRSGNKLVATEGVFSMDGDSPDLASLVALCKANHAQILLDDAHGLGVLGSQGLGSLQAQSAKGKVISQQDVPLLIGTFGKALGTGGAFVAASSDDIDYLQNTARHYIYSTAMAPSQAAATLASFNLVQQDSERRSRLSRNIALFRQNCQDLGLTLMASSTPIQPLIVGDANTVMAVKARLTAQGFWVGAIRSPTVPKGSDRLRISLNSEHQSDDIKALCHALADALEQTLSGTEHG